MFVLLSSIEKPCYILQREETPLHHAARMMKTHSINLLVLLGADLNAKNQVNTCLYIRIILTHLFYITNRYTEIVLRASVIV